MILISCSPESDEAINLNAELNQLEKNIGLKSSPSKSMIERLQAINGRFMEYGPVSTIYVHPHKKDIGKLDTARISFSYMLHTLKSGRYAEIVINDSAKHTIDDDFDTGTFQFETSELVEGANTIHVTIIEPELKDTASFESIITVN